MYGAWEVEEKYIDTEFVHLLEIHSGLLYGDEVRALKGLMVHTHTRARTHAQMHTHTRAPTRTHNAHVHTHNPE